MILNPE